MWDPEQCICVPAHHTAGCGPGGHIKANIILQGKRKKPQRELDCCLTKRKTIAALVEVCARMTSGRFQRHSLLKCFHSLVHWHPKSQRYRRGCETQTLGNICTSCSSHKQLKLQLWALCPHWPKPGACPLGSSSMTQWPLVTNTSPTGCKSSSCSRTNHPTCKPRLSFTHSPGKAPGSVLCPPEGLSSRDRQNPWLGHQQHRYTVPQVSLQQGRTAQTQTPREFTLLD